MCHHELRLRAPYNLFDSIRKTRCTSEICVCSVPARTADISWWIALIFRTGWTDPGRCTRVYAHSSGKNSTKSDWLFSTRYFIIALFWLVGINFAHFYDDKTDETHTSCVVHCSFVAFVFSLKNTSYCCLFFISNLAQGRTLVWRALANSNIAHALNSTRFVTIFVPSPTFSSAALRMIQTAK